MPLISELNTFKNSSLRPIKSTNFFHFLSLVVVVLQNVLGSSKKIIFVETHFFANAFLMLFKNSALDFDFFRFVFLKKCWQCCLNKPLINAKLSLISQSFSLSCLAQDIQFLSWFKWVLFSYFFQSLIKIFFQWDIFNFKYICFA